MLYTQSSIPSREGSGMWDILGSEASLSEVRSCKKWQRDKCWWIDHQTQTSQHLEPAWEEECEAAAHMVHSPTPLPWRLNDLKHSLTTGGAVCEKWCGGFEGGAARMMLSIALSSCEIKYSTPLNLNRATLYLPPCALTLHYSLLFPTHRRCSFLTHATSAPKDSIHSFHFIFLLLCLCLRLPPPRLPFATAAAFMSGILFVSWINTNLFSLRFTPFFSLCCRLRSRKWKCADTEWYSKEHSNKDVCSR